MIENSQDSLQHQLESTTEKLIIFESLAEPSPISSSEIQVHLCHQESQTDFQKIENLKKDTIKKSESNNTKLISKIRSSSRQNHLKLTLNNFIKKQELDTDRLKNKLKKLQKSSAARHRLGLRALNVNPYLKKQLFSTNTTTMVNSPSYTPSYLSIVPGRAVSPVSRIKYLPKSKKMQDSLLKDYAYPQATHSKPQPTSQYSSMRYIRKMQARRNLSKSNNLPLKGLGFRPSFNGAQDCLLRSSRQYLKYEQMGRYERRGTSK